MRYEQIGRHLFGTVWPRRWNCWGWLVVLAGLGWGMAPAKEVSAPENVVGKLPLYFVENRGQTDDKAFYHTLGGGDRAHFTATGVWLTQTQNTGRETDAAQSNSSPLRRVALHGAPSRSWALKLEFLGAREVVPQASVPTGATANYFRGKPERWRTGLATHTELVYPDLWPGIDLRYGGDAGRPKSTFIVAPGADPKQIRLAWRGAERVALADTGRLRVETPLGIIEEEQPVAWQERDGQRVSVAARYALESDPAGGWRYGFDLGDYDPALPLVIDPVTLGYAGFLGGGGSDSGRGIAVDGAGAAYVTGETSSGDFPTTVGVMNSSQSGYGDAFVVKVKPDGSGLVYASFLGGSDYDTGAGIAVDGTGAAYVTGTTRSSDFPTAGGLGASLNGIGDAFVAKVKPDGSGLVYAGFLGGTNDGCFRSGCLTDTGSGITVDGVGAAYVTGSTYSNDFPTVGELGASLKGFRDAFVAKVKPDGSSLAYAGLLGGGDRDDGNGIAVDGAGAAYVTGFTDSEDFPTVGGLGAWLNGAGDAFVAKVKSDGSGLAYAGFLGGGNIDYSLGIAVDGAGAAYVTGSTYSNDFPTAGGLGASLNEIVDTFVAKVKPDGSGLVYAGFLGGSDLVVNVGIAVDSAGAAYVTGRTTSSGFPVVGGPDLSYNGIGDAFVVKIVETAAPTPPIAVIDHYSGYTNQPLTVVAAGVLRNDLNSDSGILTASVVDAPSYGALKLDADGGFTYTPNKDGGSTDSFTYKANNSAGDSVPATVTLELMQPPEAVRDRADIWEGEDVGSGNVLFNDIHIIEGVATAAARKLPRHGTLALEPNGNFTYTPNPGYRGRDSFTYAIKYGSATSRPARVTLIVHGQP